MVIIFLGMRGGGSQLLMSTLLNLREHGKVFEVWVSSSNEDLDYIRTLNYPIRILDIPHKYPDLINPIILIKTIVTLVKMFAITLFSNSKILIHVMASPTDLVIDFAAKIRRKKIVRVIHDFQCHPGERWPTSRAINIRTKFATTVVTFSRYVMNNLQELKSKETIVCGLPNELVIHSSVENTIIRASERLKLQNLPIVLVIGRAEEYKGIEKLAEVASGLEEVCIFVIAGSGITGIEQSVNLTILNKWLTDAEFELLLDISHLVLFPYKEASQSGTIPLAIKKDKYIVCSNVGGLAEQIIGYPKAVLASANDVDTLTLAIIEGLNKMKNQGNQKKEWISTDQLVNPPSKGELWQVLLAMALKEIL